MRNDYSHLYKTMRWRRLRSRQLAKHPRCQCPHCTSGKRESLPASVVDHITPHKGDTKLFFDPRNLRSMAKPCHDRFKQSEERGGSGFDGGCDANGEPLNAQHAWHGDKTCA